MGRQAHQAAAWDEREKGQFAVAGENRCQRAGGRRFHGRVQRDCPERHFGQPHPAKGTREEGGGY